MLADLLAARPDVTSKNRRDVLGLKVCSVMESYPNLILDARYER